MWDDLKLEMGNIEDDGGIDVVGYSNGGTGYIVTFWPNRKHTDALSRGTLPPHWGHFKVDGLQRVKVELE